MTKKNNFLTVKLSLLMLLSTFIGGSYFPILSMYLKDFLHFSPKQAGFIMSMNIAAGILAPLVTIFIVDKLLSRKMLYSICYAIASILLFLLSTQRGFIGVLLVFTLTQVVIAPAFGMMQAIIFDNIGRDGQKSDYGKIRLWGTVGWIGAAWLIGFGWIGYLGNDRLPDTFRFASAVAVILSILIQFIPDQRKKIEPAQTKNSGEKLFSLAMLKELTGSRGIGFILILYIVSGIINSVFFFGAAPYLKQIGLAESYIMPLLTTANIIEIVTLLVLVKMQKRFGTRNLFIFSCIIQTITFAMLGFSQNIIVIVCALILQGINFGLFIPLIVIYSDTMIDSKKRTGMHQIFALTISFSNFIGNNFAGILMDSASNNEKVNYFIFWLSPVLVSVVTLLFVLFMFRQQRSCKEVAAESAL